ncbi:VOC family protein [Roseivirga sp. UBA1976]|uniref:VOC family protein n=1 Tax=Roseivirga sp. UBA1976 TaxID=1947386 RepID=UPI00257A7CFD|nr:VOC family protein [Roseivirga sp. UBA1976]|tara:strand:- start:1448 stop:1828 length:381 start_codon:yes stop_codon:yes gene_type:complete
MKPDKPFLDHFAPVVPVTNIEETIAWYEDKLRFTVEFTWETPVTYAILKRDQLVIHFSEAPTDFQLQRVHPTLYVFVRNVESLYREFKSKGLKVSELVKSDYGMTDFDLYDLNGFRISFGQGNEEE